MAVRRMRNGKYYGEMELDFFLSLPRRAQQLFFEYINDNSMNGNNPFATLNVINMDFSECESPIEKIFLFAYLLVTFDLSNLGYYRYALLPQFDIECEKHKYRADFVFDSIQNSAEDIEFKKDYKLIIECDGYEFHQKTKQQVENDNERELNMKMCGYDVIRFSGTQIYKDPMDCARKAVCMIALNVGDTLNG